MQTIQQNGLVAESESWKNEYSIVGPGDVSESENNADNILDPGDESKS